MSDQTRKLLKLFGVAVTDFEVEADKLAASAAQLLADSGKDALLALLKSSSEQQRALNQRWLEITQHVFAAQDRVLAAIGEALARQGG